MGINYNVICLYGITLSFSEAKSFLDTHEAKDLIEVMATLLFESPKKIPGILDWVQK